MTTYNTQGYEIEYDMGNLELLSIKQLNELLMSGAISLSEFTREMRQRGWD